MRCIYLIMFKKKIGMIGLGSWGKNIYRSLNYFNVVDLVYDIDLKNLNFNLVEKNKITKNIDDLFLSKKIDSIVISSPAITHKEYIIRSLVNNKNVFVESLYVFHLKTLERLKKLQTNLKKSYLRDIYYSTTMLLEN